jgi:hypothetical protein
MKKKQRIAYFDTALRLGGIFVNEKTIDLIIELNDMVVKYKGKADLKKTCKILADNMERYPAPTEIVEEAGDVEIAKSKPIFVKYPVIGGRYRHYKGGEYEVLTLEEHSETGEKMVSYKSIGFGGVTTRPLSMWFEEIKGLGTKKKPVIRFTEIKK